MRIGNEIQVLERSNLGTETTFTIDFNAKMAKILSSNLYTDKIRAVIRELSCNAFDSQVAANKAEVPFEVHLPSAMEPWFSVRDFGTGLSHSQVMNLYTTYGSSSKTNSNDYVGALGLGSKSPFAYANAFDVCSIHDGVARNYAMFLNEEGLPSCAFLGETSSSNGNGVQVKLPVKSQDFEEFKSKAALVLSWFAVQPLVVGNRGFKFDEHKVLMQGQGWQLVDSWKTNPQAVARMGCVIYPIKGSQVGKFSMMTEHPLVIDFAIGELDIAASREELSYDPVTVKVLETRLNQVAGEIADSVSQGLESCETRWQAICKLSKMMEHRQQNNLYRMLLNTGYVPFWRGQRIELNTGDWPVLFEKNQTPRILEVTYSFQKMSQVRHVALRDTVIFVRHDVSGTSSRVREMAKKGGKTYYVVDAGTNMNIDDACWNQLMEFFGNPPSVLGSSLPKPVTAKMKFKARKWTGGGYRYNARKSDNWTDEENIPQDQGGLYVVMDGLSPWHNGTEIKNFRHIVTLARELGLLDKTTPIWGLNKTNTKSIAGNESWTEFLPWIKEKFQEFSTQNKLEEILFAKQTRDDCARMVKNYTGRWLELFGRMQNSVGDFARAISPLAPVCAFDTIKAKELAVFLGVVIKEDRSNIQIVEQQMLRDFPLMQYAQQETNPQRLKSFVKYIMMVENSVDILQEAV